MSKKLQALLGLLMVFSMILGACAPAAEPVVEEPQAPIVAEEPQAPVAEVPVAELDMPVLIADFWASIPAEKGFGSVKPATLAEEMADKAPFLIDVREPAELENGYIEGAVNIPIRDLLQNLDKLPGLDEPIVIYCGSGHRGAFGLMALKMLGYTNVRNLGGGFGAWTKAELPVATDPIAAPEVISTPIVENEELFNVLNDFLVNLPANFASVKAADLSVELTESNAPILIDTRSQGEWDAGYIDGATLVEFPTFLDNLDKLPADKDANIVVYCGSGHRGAMAEMAMYLLGYTNVRNLGGGFGAWKTAGLPVAGVVDWPNVWGEFVSTMPVGYFSIKAPDLNTALAESAPFILDVRETAELEKDGYIAGAVNIPTRVVLNNLDKLPAKDQPIVVYCASGHRGALVMSALELLGYTDVKNLAGGLGAWKKAELPVETGTLPAAPTAGAAPEVDAMRLADLTAFFTNLPEGFATVKAADLNVELTGTTAPFILDVRTADEYKAGFIDGAVNINITDVPANLAQLPADKNAPIIVLCQSGHRGAIVMMYLQMIGYTNVRNLGGGMNAWTGAELPVSSAG